MNSKASTSEKTHLCGGIYGDKRCEHLLYVKESGQTHGKKVLQQYYVYCTAGGRCRSMGCAASWTGCSPNGAPRDKPWRARRKRHHEQRSEYRPV